jgi:hypothetical protein
MTEPAPDPIAPPVIGTSVVAGIAQRIAMFGVLSVLIGIGVAQAGFPPMTGFLIYVAGSLFGGLCAFVLGAVGLFLTRTGTDPVGRRNALIGMGVGLGLLALVFIPSSRAGDLPRINDITTDLEDPPSFATGPDAPDYGGRDMSYPAEFVPQVRVAYPDLDSIESDLAPDDAYERAIDTAEELGWFITYRSPAEGRFDAQDRTALFRFIDDVTVRVRPLGTGSEIDLRSKSRDGKGDLGANAARIRRFIEAF